MIFVLHPEAALEHEEQVAFYERQLPDLGARYHRAFRSPCVESATVLRATRSLFNRIFAGYHSTGSLSGSSIAASMVRSRCLPLHTIEGDQDTGATGRKGLWFANPPFSSQNGSLGSLVSGRNLYLLKTQLVGSP